MAILLTAITKNDHFPSSEFLVRKTQCSPRACALLMSLLWGRGSTSRTFARSGSLMVLLLIPRSALVQLLLATYLPCSLIAFAVNP